MKVQLGQGRTLLSRANRDLENEELIEVLEFGENSLYFALHALNTSEFRQPTNIAIDNLCVASYSFTIHLSVFRLLRHLFFQHAILRHSHGRRGAGGTSGREWG